jgi:hypothetical protein
MTEPVILWDLETVPDLSAVARLHDLPSTEPALIRDALGEKFPKHLFHSIVCIGALIARRPAIPGPWEVIALGAPHIGERTEAELIGAFVARAAAETGHLQRHGLRPAGAALSGYAAPNCASWPLMPPLLPPLH